jgi:hypothetical protein
MARRALRSHRRRVPQRGLTLLSQAAESLCGHWSGDEQGGKLIQHRVNRDEQIRGICALAEHLRQRVRLEEASRDRQNSGVIAGVGRGIHGDVHRWLTSAAPMWSPAATGAVGTPHDPNRGPICGRWTAEGCVQGGWLVAGTCVARAAADVRRHLGPTTALSEVAETAAAQTTRRQPVSCHAVRAGEAVETFATKLCRNPRSMRARARASARLNRGRGRSLLKPG